MIKIIIILFISVMIASPCHSADFYIKNGGDDAKDGLSDANAWATIAKVNAQTFSSGDKVHFKRGSLWREQLIPDSGNSTGYITYTHYGTGLMKPKLYGSTEENDVGDWSDEGGNIWSNNDATFTAEVGNIIFNNEESTAVREKLEASLNAQGEFWYDYSNDLIKIYSTSNPASFYSDIECALNRAIISANSGSYFIVENLDVRYSGNLGIETINSSNIIIRNNDVSYIGGSTLNQDNDDPRLGNAIQLWNGCANCTVERNKTWEIFDSPLTIQGTGNNQVISNVVFKNNVIWNFGYGGFEYFISGTGATVNGLYIENNTFVNPGKGWFDGQKWRGSFLACIHFGNNSATVSGDKIVVKNNISYSTYTVTDVYAEYIPRTLFVGGSPALSTTDLILDNNLHYRASGEMIYFLGNTYTLVQFSDYQTASGQDANSIAEDPLFLNTTNYSLQVASPAIDAGVDLSDVKYDYRNLGRPQDSGWDIGAYEYGSAVGASGVTLSGVTIGN